MFEYDDPEELARLVLQELTRFIDDAFPADFNTEHHYQEVLLSMRSNSLMGYEEEERQLVKWAKDNSSKIFCIDGAPGVGKSYMLAYMSERMRERSARTRCSPSMSCCHPTAKHCAVLPTKEDSTSGRRRVSDGRSRHSARTTL